MHVDVYFVKFILFQIAEKEKKMEAILMITKNGVNYGTFMPWNTRQPLKRMR